ncbi:hypothetical protein BBJ28_00001999 [Nothophytophthora sp. Chile5]|nr:hypothetical protein BBJ28_00001999 [Nothophytophthora sp. Chile5]
MKTSSVFVAFSAVAGLLLVDANYHVHHHHKAPHHGSLVKFREVEVIADNATCPNGGAVLMCESESYECQDDGTGAQACLPRTDAFLDTIDENTTISWSECSTMNASLPSKCLFDFECICMDYANVDCYCVPPDTWRFERSVAANCSTSAGDVGYCDYGEYCRTKDDYQECAEAPYMPDTGALYSDCTVSGECASGLECEDYDYFSMCVEEGTY